LSSILNRTQHFENSISFKRALLQHKHIHRIERHKVHDHLLKFKLHKFKMWWNDQLVLPTCCYAKEIILNGNMKENVFKRYFVTLMFPHVFIVCPKLATGWTVQGSNPNGDEIFRIPPDGPWGPPSLLYNGYLVPLPEVRQPVCGTDHPPQSCQD
jgi:hypothetical protein